MATSPGAGFGEALTPIVRFRRCCRSRHASGVSYFDKSAIAGRMCPQHRQVGERGMGGRGQRLHVGAPIRSLRRVWSARPGLIHHAGLCDDVSMRANGPRCCTAPAACCGSVRRPSRRSSAPAAGWRRPLLHAIAPARDQSHGLALAASACGGGAMPPAGPIPALQSRPARLPSSDPSVRSTRVVLPSLHVTLYIVRYV